MGRKANGCWHKVRLGNAVTACQGGAVMTQAREVLGTRTEVGGGTGALARVSGSRRLLADGLAQDRTVAVPRVGQI